MYEGNDRFRRRSEGKFRQGGGHESTGEWIGRGTETAGASFLDISLEYTKRSSSRLLLHFTDYLVFAADHRSLSQSRIKNLFTDS